MRLKIYVSFLSVMFLLLISAADAAAQNKKFTVSFKAGTTGATYSNTVSGYRSVDFYVKARAGQQMSVKLDSANTSLYFMVIKTGVAESIADDARDATEWAGELPDNATYIVRVYLFRNAARTNKRPVSFKVRLDVN